MELVTETSIPNLPVETLKFAADPNPFLEEARRQHPWLARFSQGYVVHGYDALCELFTDDDNLLPGFGPVIDFYGVRGSMWARFMEEIMIAVSGPTHARLRSSVVHAFTPRRANQEREMMQRVITGLLDEWAPKGEFDFAYFASLFPVSVMCGLLGVSTEPIPRMRDALENPTRDLSRIVLPPASYLHEQEKVKKRLPAAREFIAREGLNEHFGDPKGRVGIILQGGMFVSDQVELFGRYDIIMLDDVLVAANSPRCPARCVNPAVSDGACNAARVSGGRAARTSSWVMGAG